MKLVIASMMKNELGRFLRPVLNVWEQFADEIVVLDDNSTDGTRDALEDVGAHIIPREVDALPAWGAEGSAREDLFRHVWNFTPIDSYILFLDADMIPARNPRSMMETGADAVCFRLYDLWAPNRYREDEFWRGHLTPRVWMVKKHNRSLEGMGKPERSIHSGHLPTNFVTESWAYVPTNMSLMHYAYSTPELREEKFVQYMSVSDELTNFEQAHARSILDPEPNLAVLPFVPEYVL